MSRLRQTIQLETQRAIEYLTLDSTLGRAALSAGASAAALALYGAGRREKAIDVAMALHRAGYGGPASTLMDCAFDTNWTPGSRFVEGARQAVLAACREHVEQLQPSPATARFFAAPEALLGSVVMVLRSPSGTDKGVVVVLYSHILPVFARLFDLASIQREYHVVIEPSWVGYCNTDVLSYYHSTEPVFVQAFEPVDRQFIDRQRSRLVTVPIMNNWWVDHRLFNRLPNVDKDADVIMVSAWGKYKRHARFFAALKALRERGRRLRVILIGYGQGMSMQDVQALAVRFGIADQLEWHEGLTPAEVNHRLNRAKVNVLWSRKEGANRSIIEGMCAGLPCIMRDGFNYGFKYPYINQATGAYATEASLPDVLLETVENYQRFSPRPWVLENMSCQTATAILEETIASTVGRRPAPLAVKVNGLHGMSSWEPSDAERFVDDYARIARAKRKHPSRGLERDGLE